MGVFSNISGIPATPLFVEIVNTWSMSTSNGSAKPVVNVYHYRQIGGPVAVSITAILSAFRTAMDTALKSALSVEAPAASLKGRFMDDPTTGFTFGSAMSAGTVTGDRMPLYGTVTCQLKTAGRGRSYRGSKHYAPIAESSTTLDNLNAGGQTLWDAVAAALQATVTLSVSGGSTWRLIVLSPTLSKLDRNPAIFSGADVTTVTANSTLGTMRHRKEKPVIV